MSGDNEGICAACACKPRPDGEAPAALCGHPARPIGSRFCIACAATHGVCRLCGLKFVTPNAEQDP